MKTTDFKDNNSKDISTFKNEVVCVEVLKTQERFLKKHLIELENLKEKIRRMKQQNSEIEL